MELKDNIICLILLITAIILGIIIAINDNKNYNKCIDNNGYNCIGLIE